MYSNFNVDEEQELFIKELKDRMRLYGTSLGYQVLDLLVNNKEIPAVLNEEVFVVTNLRERQEKLNRRVSEKLDSLQSQDDKVSKIRQDDPLVQAVKLAISEVEKQLEKKTEKHQEPSQESSYHYTPRL